MTAQDATQLTATSLQRRRSLLPWIILGIWFVWLGVLVVLSLPYWTQSKANLIEIRGEPGPAESQK